MRDKPADKQGLRVTGILLTGGEGRRLGRAKDSLRLGEYHLGDRSLRVLEAVCHQAIVVGRSNGTGSPPLYGLTPVYQDEIPGEGPLVGLYTGLKRISSPFGLLLACDMPFVQEVVLRELIASLPAECDALIARHHGVVEPLCSIYARRCLPAIEQALARGDRRMRSFWDDVAVEYLDLDSQFPSAVLERAFFNLNTPADLSLARSWLEATGDRGDGTS